MKKVLSLLAVCCFSATVAAEGVDLTLAKARFLSEDSKLNIVWGAFSPSDRQFLRRSQQQWLRNKDVICGKVTSKVSEYKLVEIYNCHTMMTIARTKELDRMWRSIYD